MAQAQAEHRNQQNQDERAPLIEERQEEGQVVQVGDPEDNEPLTFWGKVECFLDLLLDNSIWIMIAFPILMVLSKVVFCPEEGTAANATSSSDAAAESIISGEFSSR